jgi:hypothetical protein
MAHLQPKVLFEPRATKAVRDVVGDSASNYATPSQDVNEPTRNARDGIIGTIEKYRSMKMDMGPGFVRHTVGGFPNLYYKKSQEQEDVELEPIIAEQIYKTLPDDIRGKANYDLKIPPQYLRWIRQQREAANHARFDAWLENKMVAAGVNNPGFYEFVKEHYPEYFTARLEHAKMELDLINAFTELKIKGPYESWDLFVLKWMEESGLITAPTRMPWDWAATVGYGAGDAGANLKRGFLSVKRWTPVPTYNNNVDWKAAATDWKGPGAVI